MRVIPSCTELSVSTGVENVYGCNDVYNKFYRGDQLASIPTSEAYRQLEVVKGVVW